MATAGSSWTREELVRQGKRVLLVSPASAAIDDALHAVVRRMSPQPGTVIRVGPARLEEIASDPDVQLERLAARASREVDEQRTAVADRLREIDEVDARIERLRAELGDYDEPAYGAAAARVAAAREAEEVRPRLPEAESEAEATRRAALAAASELRAALAAAAELDDLRDALEHERNASTALELLEQRLKALRQARAALDEQTPSGWIARRRHRRWVDAADAELSRFTAVATDGRRRWLDVQLQAREVIGERGQDEVDRADRRVAEAEEALTMAEREYRLARDALAGVRSALDEAEARGSPTDDERRLVAEAEAQDLPARHARLQKLLDRPQQSTAELRESLEPMHRTLVDQARSLRTAAEAEIVREARVVATTLARSRVHPALADAQFDVVLVDEAAAATLAEVLLVLCPATATAVLFGDFLQLGPVLDDAAKNDSHPALRRWVHGTCFSHVGIEAPADAGAHDGCMALTHQFRFGPNLRRLANDTIYELLRDAEEVPDVARQPQTDVVLIDVPDLAEVLPGAVSGRWWPACAVLSRALAEAHAPDGPVGVVVPCTAQAEATLAALRDGDLVGGAGVGTVHSLQDRDYPTAVFDLVENGRGRVAGEWEDDGRSLFGVGLTRARDRLYLIAGGTAVRPAAAGPLRVLRDGIHRGEVQVWSAAALLGTADPPPGLADTAFTDVSAQLRQLVTVTDVDDEPTYGRELERHLVSAQHSVQMWAPWVADREREAVPLLQNAARRGVDVRVFVRPGEDSGRLPELQDSGATVIRSDHEHAKLVVVDERVVLLGSRNTRSDASGPSGEIMISRDRSGPHVSLLTLGPPALDRVRPLHAWSRPLARRIFMARTVAQPPHSNVAAGE